MSRPLPPRFVWLSRAAALTVVSFGFAALRIGGELPGMTAALALGAVVASALPDRPRLSPGVWVVIQLGFLAWLAAGQVMGTRHVLTTFADLLIFVQLHRLLTRSGPRDDLYSYFIAFGQLLLASVLTVDVAFLVIFVGFIVSLVWALLLTRLELAVERDSTVRRAGRPATREDYAALDSLLRWPAFVAVTSLLVVLMAGTLGLFFVLPRLEASFLSTGLLPPVHVSGFTEQVRLGEIGLVQLSNEPVMRVRTSGPDGAPVPADRTYWRGLAMDRFDGRAWTVSDPARIRLAWIGGAGSTGPPRKAAWSLRQEINLEPLDSRAIFAAAEPVGLYGDFRSLEAASTEGFFAPGVRRRLSYVAYSEPLRPDLETLRSSNPADSEPDLVQLYTQLPADLTPRVGELAAEWTRGASSPADAALLVQERLRSDFNYGLEQPASAFPDPIAAFLDEVREGHCEYFATTMALMVRSLGMPSRVVNGFQGGEWNPVGEYWLVRQRDAHSWVEVHFPDVGWVTFDPTPAAAGGVTGRARIGLLARLDAWSDYGRVRWASLMLDYGMDNQAAGLRAMLSFMQGGGSLDLGFLNGRQRADREERSGEGSGFGWLLLVAGLAVAAFFAARWLRGGNARLADRDVRRLQGRVEALRRRWSRLGTGAPDAPAPNATALSWARWAASEHAALEAAPACIERYHEARFGGRPAPGLAEDLVRLARLSPRRPARTARRSASRR